MHHPISYQTAGMFYGQVVPYEEDMFDDFAEAQDVEVVEIYSNRSGNSFGGENGIIIMDTNGIDSAMTTAINFSVE